MRGATAMGRNTWRQLTAMGTALVLLFLLALAAIPGAVLPQRGLNSRGSPPTPQPAQRWVT
jgi:cytochrome c biogenesis protein